MARMVFVRRVCRTQRCKACERKAARLTGSPHNSASTPAASTERRLRGMHQVEALPASALSFAKSVSLAARQPTWTGAIDANALRT